MQRLCSKLEGSPVRNGRMPFDLAGCKFGKLTVGRRALNPRFWHCECECGGRKLVRRDSLVTGNTKSCGCLRLVAALAALKIAQPRAAKARKGTTHSEETKARMRSAALGRKLSEETKAKLSAIMKAKRADPAYRAKHAAAMMAPEARHAMGGRWRGPVMGDTTKAAISAGLKRAYAEGRRCPS